MFTVWEFSGYARIIIAVELNFIHDKISDGVGNIRAGLIWLFTINGTAIINQKTEDLLRELCSGSSKANKGMDIGRFLFSWSWGRAYIEFKRKSKKTPNGWETADDIDTIDGAAASSISTGMSSFVKYSVGTTFVRSNINVLIDKAM